VLGHLEIALGADVTWRRQHGQDATRLSERNGVLLHPKALYERDGTAVGIGDAMGACSSALPGEHLVQEHADDLAQQVGIASEQKPNLAW
jgi:hypothetical protein